MDQQPKIPTLKDAQKPQVKVKGMGAGLTLFDRLKQFKKKDLAFILAGLGTLFMAPLAEHFMMAPESGSELKGGFGGGQGGSGSNLFGSGSSPYESGNNSIAQGGAIGGAGDIITPLNVRDPSALVMGPGQSQQPPAGSAAPAAPPVSAPSTSKEDFKDALAGAASRAASAAVKKSPLPIPKIAVGGSGLRGLGAASGGSSAGASLGAVGPAAGSNGVGGGGGGLNLVRANPNFRGVAGARGPGNPTGLDGTKKAGANAGDNFNRAGNAQSGLNAAASEQIPTGGTGFAGGGQGGAGANDKPGGGGQAPGSKSVGESLAFIEAKERMMENLKLEFEKRKLKDPELLMYGIRNDVLKASAGEVGKWITKGLMDGADKLLSPGGADAWSLSCGSAGTFPVKDTYKKDEGGVLKTGEDYVYYNKAGEKFPCKAVQGAAKGGAAPNAAGGGVVGGDPVAGGAVDTSKLSTGDGTTPGVLTLGEVCTKLEGLTVAGADKLNDAKISNGLHKEAAVYASIRDALTGTKGTDCSGGDAEGKGRLADVDAITASVASRQKDLLDSKIKDQIKTMKDAVGSETVVDYKPAIDGFKEPIEAVRTDLETIRKAAGDDLTVAQAAPASRGWNAATTGVAGNAATLEAIDKAIAAARTKTAADLKSAIEAQDTLDGKKDGKSEARDAVYPQLKEIVEGGQSSPIGRVQTTNGDYKTTLSKINGPDGKPVTAPSGGTPEKYDATANGIKGAAEGGVYDTKQTAFTQGNTAAVAAKKDYDTKEGEAIAAEAAAVAPPLVEIAKQARLAADAAKEVAATKKTEADAKLVEWNNNVLGVQDAQRTWLQQVDDKRQVASGSVPK